MQVLLRKLGTPAKGNTVDKICGLSVRIIVVTADPAVYRQ
jgi:hypothetical protein